MKKVQPSIKTVWLLLAATLVLASCKKMDGYNEPVSADKSVPGQVTDIKVTNFNGGAYITYTLPKSDNLLYVQARYRINDQQYRESKSSYYSDTITVEGFEKAAEYDVVLYSVSRANVKSDSIIVKVQPETPHYQLIRPTVQYDADFGGLNIRAENPSKQPIGLILLKLDSNTNVMEIEDQYYTDADSINFSVRGYDTMPRRFGVYVTDRWGNISDTLIQTIKPLFETLADKSKFFEYRLSSDTEIGYGWSLSNLWNGNNDGTGWHTNPGGSFPILCTFGMGQLFKISRFMVWERAGEFTYGHGNPSEFTLWGSTASSPQNAAMPLVSDVGTVVGDWVNLGNYKFPDAPSGLPPGVYDSKDEAFVRAGVNFNVPFTSPAVRFLRIGVAKTWSNADFAHLMEVSVYGKPE
ncbi:MAG: DUF5000 domain-containing lipoprotein [Candidatus Pseudobacter hemicellulosilyticus]|uniref:DUF5000 domain-containing lipoprotein n=1 Tax=Candidatus Pseudobacter hemicellulosilyticus TaxID=3121375 RepID=A0AAJ5WZU3_9BACT|nr:MAG: DUF5000 domain-containing lipoprotein [Pseudobacter sp.]